MPNGPSYVPRKFCEHPTLFGVNLTVHLKPTGNSKEEWSLCAAAEIQHRFACYVNGALASQKQTRQWLAGMIETDRTRLGRLLNGRTPMRLADMGRITKALHLDLPAWPESG